MPDDLDLKMGRKKLKLTEVRKTIKESGRVFFCFFFCFFSFWKRDVRITFEFESV